MRKYLVAFLIGLFSLSAFAEDTLFVKSHNRTDMVWHVSYDQMTYFPTEGKTYRKILMYYTLGCASGGCSHWDYDVLAQIMHNTGTIDSSVTNLDTVSTNPLVVDTTWRVFDVLEPYEMGRLITPYGNYMDYRDYPTGINGFDSSWQHTFVYDVTDYVSLLKDSVLIRTKYNGWSSGFSCTMDFAFIEGTPQREVIALQNVYTRGGGYQGTEDYETRIIPPKTFEIPEGTESAATKVIITGHGNNAGTNCGEFCDKNYYMKVNGDTTGVYRMWRTDCDNVPVRPQGGTYLYPRANWCPGDKVAEQRWEIDPSDIAGDSVTVDLDIEPYVNSGSGGSSHNISSTIFFYGPDNYGLDAELHTIIAPSNASEHINYNPSCGDVIVVIKNNARETLTYSKIEYGPVGGKQRIGEWNGSLEFNEMDTVILPPPYWNGIDPGHVQFQAKLITPNHRIREGNEENNVFTSNMELAPRWEPIRVMMRTNGQPQENRVEITDQNGTIVWEQKDLNANEIYNWNVNLSAGCYKFTIYDEGFDGLHWWVYAQSGQPTRTGGFIRVMKQTGAGIYVNKNDFGREYSENFIIGEMTVAEAPVTTAEDIEVFPNPSKDGEINVLIPGWNVGLAKITVTDRLGRIILERENTPTDTEHWEVLKVKTLIDSFFFVKVEAGDKVKTEKVLIFEN